VAIIIYDRCSGDRPDMAKAFKLLLSPFAEAMRTFADLSTRYQHRQRQSLIVLARSLTMFFLAGWALCFAQESGQEIRQSVPALPPQPTPQSEAAGPSFTFKTVSSIVVVDLVARDKEDNPVRDLTSSEVRISEKIDDSSPAPEKIASFEPVTEATRQRATRTGGIVLGWLHKSSCPLTGAYELSYYLSPESRKDGLHRILVTSSRPGLRLFFRPGYRIEAEKPVGVSAAELTDKKTSPQLQEQQRVQTERERHPELELARMACYDALDLTSFDVNIRKVKTLAFADQVKSKTDNTKQEVRTRQDTYEFVVPPSYFSSLPAVERSHPTQLDFSFCTFDSSGHPFRHFDGTVEARTTSTDNESLTDHGLTHRITVEAPPCRMLGRRLQCDSQPNMMEISGQWFPQFDLSARLIVRDRNTGAIGSGEILLADLGPDPFHSPIPEGQTTDSFGTLNPTTALAMCGDVYQLAPWTTNLPLFSELDAVAPVYTTSLGVYSRFFTAGIPHITSRTEWFGVNYQGRFGVDKPGKYEFNLLSDDGAKVYIDDKLIVSDDTLHSPQRSRSKPQLSTGAHSIRVSYFQGPRTEVALVLLVKPPGRGWRLFDTRDFATPEEPALQRKKLSLPER